METSSTLDHLRGMWGGRMPTWEEFKRASKEGRVRTNKSIALQTMWWSDMPKVGQVLFGIITGWGMYLVVPIAIGAYFFLHCSGWWIVGSLLAAWFLAQVTKEGACETIVTGAERNEEVYEILVNRGAFLFGPAD